MHIAHIYVGLRSGGRNIYVDLSFVCMNNAKKKFMIFYNFNVFTSSLYHLECRIQTRKPSILQVQYYRFCQISPNIWTEVAPVVLSKVSRNKTVKKSVKTKSARREFKFLQRIFKFIFFTFLTENKVSGKQIFTLARGGRRVRL